MRNTIKTTKQVILISNNYSFVELAPDAAVLAQRKFLSRPSSEGHCLTAAGCTLYTLVLFGILSVSNNAIEGVEPEIW